jgi:hypothetical protein
VVLSSLSTSEIVESLLSNLKAMSNDPRTGLIRSITAPLGFYVLALLIVEGFLGIAIVEGSLTSSLKQLAIYAGIGMFLLVVGLVFSLVWFRPRHLVYDKETLAKERDYETQLDFRTKDSPSRLIAEMHELRRRGGLSEEEFVSVKAVLLDRLGS